MDNFQNMQDTVSSPARSLIGVTPADGIPLAFVPKAIYVGAGGDLNVRCIEDQTATILRNVASGSILPIRAAEILSTGTTASDLVLLT